MGDAVGRRFDWRSIGTEDDKCESTSGKDGA